jgi:hypothetical protein
MRYMSLWRPRVEPVGPPNPDEIAKMGALIEELFASGVLIATDGLQASAKRSIVRKNGDAITITDGPFAETKELVAGYAIFNVKSKEHMLDLTKRFLHAVGEDGSCEISPMYDDSPGPAPR